jgi:hypothetical protein
MESAESNLSAPAARRKPKLKKKVENDPFASDINDDISDEEGRKEELKRAKAKAKDKRSNDDGSDGDEEDRPKKKQK